MEHRTKHKDGTNDESSSRTAVEIRKELEISHFTKCTLQVIKVQTQSRKGLDGQINGLKWTKDLRFYNKRKREREKETPKHNKIGEQ